MQHSFNVQVSRAIEKNPKHVSLRIIKRDFYVERMPPAGGDVKNITNCLRLRPVTSDIGQVEWQISALPLGNKHSWGINRSII